MIQGHSRDTEGLVECVTDLVAPKKELDALHQGDEAEEETDETIVWLGTGKQKGTESDACQERGQTHGGGIAHLTVCGGYLQKLDRATGGGGVGHDATIHTSFSLKRGSPRPSGTLGVPLRKAAGVPGVLRVVNGVLANRNHTRIEDIVLLGGTRLF